MYDFYTEFSEFISLYAMHRHNYLIVGDFNFHVNNQNSAKSNKFKEILEIFDLTQHINEATHSGNTLDLIITPRDLPITNIKVGELISDHTAITFNIEHEIPRRKAKEFKYRKMNQIDYNRV
jgi:endonuclease/exonuclease/phosphatase family metal-dependent hydrolase